MLDMSLIRRIRICRNASLVANAKTNPQLLPRNRTSRRRQFDKSEQAILLRMAACADPVLNEIIFCECCAISKKIAATAYIFSSAMCEDSVMQTPDRSVNAFENGIVPDRSVFIQKQNCR
jgi:hypothetical protein